MTDALDLRPSVILPDWPAPANVGAFVTTRESGPSQGPYAAFNTASHVGDKPEHVSLCRRQLGKEIGDERPLLWLDQVHGASVQHGWCDETPKADAAVATTRDYACVVMTADCLPVFFCDRSGERVAVAHAGWRSLAGGVLEATVASLGSPAGELLAWLGPAISNAQFEVGPEVREAFCGVHPEASSAFEPSPYRLGHYMADLYRLARLRLERLGVAHVSGGHFCTACESRFYSHRRDDGVTGRMASVIWLR
ncbi:peptidoglycan editing factor PgeF [Halomonas denitrificans]|uniref:peptidoglycan editing factor PgeF n=1 Tax=Halomonas TaxID=2745 RepID=UPI001A8D6A88|nr:MULTISPECIES: peptidoglycan editing factor PgeF [Halomonas]MED5296951.1 peptidoglycan editing factor PgeF [Pseudomonadota bacterium]MBN8413887.1 peptidoglycan editing factor PgeF [Halomonas litopenaei]MBY5926911.1 peptidoglycan editing factor PgeF [Halomonas sp. DP4Y7-2]MBY5930333.1 peptidoglycan editing factor PgeF [Halomonas sp. DP8Y7-3]MBY5970141.1 peptidoglycan editing factor PgeF [Halomonas denitrificans]